MDEVMKQLKCVKAASARLMVLDEALRKQVLVSLAELLKQSVEKIIQENKKDLDLMDKNDPKYDRLMLTKQQIHAMADDVALVADLPQPVGRILENKLMPNGLNIQKIAVPIGVVAVIYESRPNVTIDVFTLCFKTANACVLKGGKEAHYSNHYLMSLIHQALDKHKVDKDVAYLLPVDREAMKLVLNALNYVDVCIPRGSQALINYVREHAKIPVIETGAGIVHIYFDKSGSAEKGRLIINNAKTRRVSVCNALDTLVVHNSCLPVLADLVALLASANVALFADEKSYGALEGYYPKHLLHKACAADFGIEFLDYKMSIKTVNSIEEAVEHIMQHTSRHSEAIIAEDKTAIDYFLSHIDAAAVYVNASTAFTDGGQFGMGAEIGISTQKLHARGPMGLDALTSYKWLILGDGQIRA